MEAKYQFFRNLRTGAFSVRRRGKVVSRTDWVVLLGDVTFVVQPSGRAEAQKTHQRTVHAFVTGAEFPQKNVKPQVHSVQDFEMPGDAEIFEVSYNPYDEERDGFYDKATGRVFSPDETFDWALAVKRAPSVAVYVGKGTLPPAIKKAVRWGSVKRYGFLA